MAKRVGPFTTEQVAYLQVLVSSDIQRMRQLRDHAHSHGDINYYPPELTTAELCLEKFNTAASTTTR